MTSFMIQLNFNIWSNFIRVFFNLLVRGSQMVSIFGLDGDISICYLFKHFNLTEFSFMVFHIMESIIHKTKPCLRHSNQLIAYK